MASHADRSDRCPASRGRSRSERETTARQGRSSARASRAPRRDRHARLRGHTCPSGERSVAESRGVCRPGGRTSSSSRSAAFRGSAGASPASIPNNRKWVTRFSAEGSGTFWSTLRLYISTGISPFFSSILWTPRSSFTVTLARSGTACGIALVDELTARGAVDCHLHESLAILGPIDPDANVVVAIREGRERGGKRFARAEASRLRRRRGHAAPSWRRAKFLFKAGVMIARSNACCAASR